MKLKIKTLYLSEKQINYFDKESKRLKIKTSELIRRALDEYIKIEEKILLNKDGVISDEKRKK